MLNIKPFEIERGRTEETGVGGRQGERERERKRDRQREGGTFSWNWQQRRNQERGGMQSMPI